MGLPHLLSRRGIERDDAPPEGATFVRRHAARAFLERRHRDVQTALVQNRGTGDHGIEMIVHFHFPLRLAVQDVERVDLRMCIAKEDGLTAAICRSNKRGRTDARIRLERPMEASRRGVERTLFWITIVLSVIFFALVITLLLIA